MEHPTTVDLISLGVVALGWFLLLVPGVKLDTFGKKRDTETSTPSARQGQKLGKLVALGRSVAAKGLRAVARSLALVGEPWE